MKSAMPDPIKQLENTIDWHKGQIELIKRAITVLKGNDEQQEKQDEFNQEAPPAQEPSHKIKWSKEIDRVFEEHDDLSKDEVIEKLIENGIQEASTPKNRSIVYCSLVRKCKGEKKTLSKNEDGVYSLIRRRRTAPIRRSAPIIHTSTEKVEAAKDSLPGSIPGSTESVEVAAD